VEAWTRYAAIVVPFGTMVGLVRLFGYWVPLGINPLEYVGFSDVARLSLLPMAFAIGAMFIGLIVAEFLKSVFPPKQDIPFNRAPTGVKIGFVVFWILYASFLTYTLIWGEEPRKWYALAAIGSTAALGLAHSSAFSEHVDDPRLRFIAFYVCLYLPVVGFADGRSDVFDLRSGKSQLVIEHSRLPIGIDVRATPRHPALYAGRLGDRIVVFETLTAKVVLLREDHVPELVLREK